MTKDIVSLVIVSLCRDSLLSFPNIWLYWPLEVKMKLSLCLIKHHFKILCWGKIQESSSPKERAPITHWIGDWLNVRAGLDAEEKRKSVILLSINPQFFRTPFHNLITILSEVSQLSNWIETGDRIESSEKTIMLALSTWKTTNSCTE